MPVMETLKNYLETMFMKLPNTPEVRRAKDELWQMMEDKYAELTAEGHTENEVIGTIISEFGNLSEVAEELGIESVVAPQSYADAQPSQEDAQEHKTEYTCRVVTMDEAKDFLKDSAGSALCIALGVMLCILSVTGPIVMSAVHLDETLGVVGMIAMIAVAVVLFVVSGVRMQKWDFLKKQPCAVDFATNQMVSERRERYRVIYTPLLAIGIMLCVLCIIPPIIMDKLNPLPGLLDMATLGAAGLFVLAATGVFMIVLACCTQSGYKALLSLNSTSTMAGTYQENEGETYKVPFIGAIMSVYWPTVTCIYLCWSFLSFEWGSTWIIWPAAAIINVIIDGIFKE